MNIFYKRINDEDVSINLFSLEEYEEDGGRYVANNKQVNKEEFLAACAIGYNYTGLTDEEILEEIGVPENAYWYDSATGYFLLRQWPADAPLEARCF